MFCSIFSGQTKFFNYSQKRRSLKLRGVFEIFEIKLGQRVNMNFFLICQNSISGFQKGNYKNVFFTIILKNDKVLKKHKALKRKRHSLQKRLLFLFCQFNNISRKSNPKLEKVWSGIFSQICFALFNTTSFFKNTFYYLTTTYYLLFNYILLLNF